MEEVIRTFLPLLSTAFAFFMAIILGAWLRDWTYRNTLGSRYRKGADLKAEAKERKQLQREIRKQYAYLNQKGSNESISSKVVTKIKKLINHGNK